MKTIPLTQGKEALVSDKDYVFLCQWKWFFARYAKRKERKLNIYMHRVILARKLGHNNFAETDHCDENPLNNIRDNLRAATVPQNQANHNSRKGVSKYRGVSYRKDRGNWNARIQFNGMYKSLGSFDTEEEAAQAYDMVATRLHGEFAKLNLI